ncbi:MAG: U32 family peptidase [Clostridia bacterium]|nr:U32 family peptidase [Clostridia bacterium]
MKKPELLAPAGSFNTLKYAFVYGADAVYIGGEEFSLRTASKNFDRKELEEAVRYTHGLGKKIYVAVNIFCHNGDIAELSEYAKYLELIKVDGVIISDIGALSVVSEVAPNLPIHISTQANTTNAAAVKAWQKLGAVRVVPARELSLEEIKQIKSETDCEIESFIHGAMCISYSGRCLMSNYFTGRGANQGACAHPCRWEYSIKEKTRPDEEMPVVETERGTFIFNSKDLCMIEYIPELIEAGVDSFKIEGRVKNELYVATVVSAYRQAIDAYMADKDGYTLPDNILDELKKVSHRGYTTGFYFGKPGADAHNFESSEYIREYGIVGVVKEYDAETGIAKIEQRNRFFAGDELEILVPNGGYFTQVASDMKNEKGDSIDVAPNAQMTVYMKTEKPVAEFSILRKKV